MHRVLTSVEQLESRQLLASAVLGLNGVLSIAGDDGVNDLIDVGLTDDGTGVGVGIAGVDPQFFDADDVRKVVIRGLGGNDEIFVDLANGTRNIPARVDGGAGDDSIQGGAENDVITGGPGNDNIQANGGKNAIDGGSGNDILWGGPSSDAIKGGSGNDALVGFDGKDVLYGAAGNDTLWGFEANDLLDGGPGNDELYGSTGNDILVGGTGNDLLEGEAGKDLLFGVSGSDSLLGGPGNDILWGGGRNQNDLIDDGDGNDWIIPSERHAFKKLAKLIRKLKAF